VVIQTLPESSFPTIAALDSKSEAQGPEDSNQAEQNLRVPTSLAEVRNWLRGKELGAVLSRGAGSAFGLKVLGAGLAFGVQVLLARLLGVTDYGIYIYAYTWMQVLVLVGRMGVDKGVIRFAPEYTTHNQWGRLRGLLQFGVRTVLIASSTIAALGALAVWMLRDTMPLSQPETLYWALAILPIFGLVQLWKGTLQAFKRIAWAFSPELFGKHALIGVGAYALYWWQGGELMAPSAMWVTFGAMLAICLVGGGLVWKAVPDPTWTASPRTTSRYWLRIAFPMMLIAGMNVVMKRTDVLMIGSLLGPKEAGVYGASVRISELAHYGLQSIDAIAAPLISELYYAGEREKLQRLVTWAARGALAVASVVTLGLLLIGPFILGLFGAEFEQGYIPLIVLLGGQLINSFAGVVGFLMMMTGHQDASVRILVVATIANIALNALLIPLFGMVGGAIATASTLVFWNVWMVYYARNQIAVSTTAIQF